MAPHSSTLAWKIPWTDHFVCIRIKENVLGQKTRMLKWVKLLRRAGGFRGHVLLEDTHSTMVMPLGNSSDPNNNQGDS